MVDPVKLTSPSEKLLLNAMSPCKYSRMFTLSKYADKMLTKSLIQCTVIGRIQLITCELKVKFHSEAAALVQPWKRNRKKVISLLSIVSSATQ